MNILIVDDEPLALELLEGYVRKVPDFRLAGKCSNALEAFALLNREKVDVIFLDINMPEISGMDLLKMLKNPPYVVFTTAYTEYAAESYNYNVIDYLVKPITFDRFMKAVHKLSDLDSGSKEQGQRADNTVFVRSDGKMIRIDLDQLQFVEGYKNYVRLWTSGGKILVHNTMKHFEDYLEGRTQFLRVHKSYIVNLNHVSEFAGNFLRIGNEQIAIGATYREDVAAALNRFRQL